MTAVTVDTVKTIALVAVIVLGLIGIVMVRVAASIALKVVVLVVLAALAATVWSQRVSLQDCADRITAQAEAASTSGQLPASATCTFFGTEVEVQIPGA